MDTPPHRPPAIALINLAVFGVFMVIAGIGTLVPPLVKDRLPDQIRPLWQRLLAMPDDEWNMVGESVAVTSQWLIGLTEFFAGALALAALIAPTRRTKLAGISLAVGTGLFGTFMAVLFFLHETDLPKWSQYPALLVWIGATWMLLNTSAPASA